MCNLSRLYKQLEEWDIIQAIFLEKMNCKESIQRAIKYESDSCWKHARDLYSELLETDLSKERKDFYYESYFKCFANLGEWENIPDAITSVVEEKNTWKCLWDGGWYQQKLLTWYITAQVKNGIFMKNLSDEFLDNINSCISDDDKRDYLKTFFSEELCMIALIQNDVSLATGYLKSYIKYFLQDWQLTKPMLQSLRYHKLLKLQSFIETSDFINVFNNLSEDFETSVPKLTDKWEKMSKEVLPSVMLNETRHLYRLQFINILIDKLSTLDDRDYKEYEKQLKICKIKMDLNLINIAAEKNNYHLSKKYYKPYSEKGGNAKLKMAFGNIGLAKSHLVFDAKGKLEAALVVQTVFGKYSIF